MQEIPQGILPEPRQASELTIAIGYRGEFEQSYVATTPPESEPDARLGVEAELSGAAAKRRLIAMLRRSGYVCPVKVVSGAELDHDPDYYLQYPQPEGRISREVQEAVDLSASLLDDLYRDWEKTVDVLLLEQGPNAAQFDSSVLAQLYADHDDGIETLDRDLHNNLKVLRTLKEGSEPFLGFEPFRVHCHKDQRQLVYDLCDLYWRIEILRRQDLYSF